MPRHLFLPAGRLRPTRRSTLPQTKRTSKLRSANPENRVLLKTEMGAGHGGPSGRYDAWRDEAFVCAFVLDALGLVDVVPAPYPDTPVG